METAGQNKRNSVLCYYIREFHYSTLVLLKVCSYIYTKLGSKFFILIYMTNQITRNYLRTPLVKLSLFIRIINLEIWHSAWKSDGYRV